MTQNPQELEDPLPIGTKVVMLKKIITDTLYYNADEEAEIMYHEGGTRYNIKGKYGRAWGLIRDRDFRVK